MFGGTLRAPPGSANCGLGDAPYIQGRSRCLERGDAHRRAATQHNSAELESVQHQACRIVIPCSATPSSQARVSQWSRSRTCIHLLMRRSGVQIPLWADFSFAFVREIVRGARGLVGIFFCCPRAGSCSSRSFQEWRRATRLSPSQLPLPPASTLVSSASSALHSRPSQLF